MPNSTITCAYKVTALGGQPVEALQARMAAVPVDLTLPLLFGLRYVSDVTASVGNVITRTMGFSMGPVTPATVTAVLNDSSTGAPVDETIVSVEGAGYVAAPVVTQSGGKPTRKAVFTPVMSVTDGIVVKAGLGYHAMTTSVALVGGNQVGSDAPATATVSLGGSGEVTGVAVTFGSEGFTSPPTAIITDTDPNPGSGAVISMGLGVVFLDIIGDGGIGYSSPPTIHLTSSFKVRYPDGTDQKSALSNFMTQVFEQALQSDVFALVPVIS